MCNIRPRKGVSVERESVYSTLYKLNIRHEQKCQDHKTQDGENVIRNVIFYESAYRLHSLVRQSPKA